MTRTFNNRERSTGMTERVKGTGSFTVDLAFLPDYLSAKFATQGTYGNQHDGKAAATDMLYWELASVTPTTFTFTVYYTCTHERDIQWVAAKLPKLADMF